MTKEKHDYPLLTDSVAKKIFKNSVIGKEYSARIVSTILKMPYEKVYQNLYLVSEDISFSSKTVQSTADVMFSDNTILLNIEINYFNGPTKKVQMNSYVYQLYLGQITSYKEYSNVKKVIQIIIEDTDFFKLNDFVYSIAFMERKHGITDDEKIERYRINLDYLGKMKYTDIKKSELAYLLYIFVCGWNKLDQVYNGLYKDDEFMKKVINESKEIARDLGIKLYFPLTEEEIRKADEEYFINEGIKKGIEQGIEQGIKQGINEGAAESKREIIINMYNDHMNINLISKYTNLQVEEVKKIIDSNKEKDC